MHLANSVFNLANDETLAILIAGFKLDFYSQIAHHRIYICISKSSEDLDLFIKVTFNLLSEYRLLSLLTTLKLQLSEL